VQAAAISGFATDAAEVRFPIQQPLPVQTVAVYGRLGPSAERAVDRQALVLPEGSRKDFGGLEVQLSSTRLQTLSEGARYLLDYPYGCAEQVASRLLAATILLDSFDALGAVGVSGERSLRALIDDDVAALERIQDFDGGWSYWRRGHHSDPYLSAHVGHALARARRAGFAPQEKALERWEKYAEEGVRYRPMESRGWLSSRLTEEEALEPENLLIQAYELYVQNLLRESDAARSQELRAKTRAWYARAGLERLPLEAAARCLVVLGSQEDSRSEAVEIRRYLENHVKETARSAHLEAPADPSWTHVLPSSLRAHAVLLEAQVELDPTGELADKLAEGLLDRRRQGRWRTTEENAFAVVALSRYFEATASDVSELVGRVWLDRNLLCEHAFSGRELETSSFEVPSRLLEGGGGSRLLTFAKEGTGSLFYQARLRYAPKEWESPPPSFGLEVSRAYEGVDGELDVKADDDGMIRVRAGALVRVRLFVFTPSERRHIALVDPYPAGMEGGRSCFEVWRDDWKSGAGELHRLPCGETRFRDDRAEAFVGSLPRGFYVHEYLIRATTPGVFLAPPPKAEAMYEPEVFGYGIAQRVRIVED
ncbi:MAG: hypothetical protein JXA90_02670, partial [Planctomycetes bacterium]|nr:hypothetical protein [Planctomycetota bacterium]